MDPSYNNIGGFGSGGITSPAPIPVSAPVSSGTGDIVLTPEKKTHKKKIIVSLIIVVLIVGGVFMVMFLNFKGDMNSNVKIAFNRYANYYLFGEDSDAELNVESVEETEEYIIDSLVTEGDGSNNENELLASTFFSKAEQLWNTFYKGLSDKELLRFDGLLDIYAENFEFTRTFMVSPTLNSEIFAERFMTMDRDSLNRWIENYYANYVNSEYKNIQEYGRKGIHYYDLYTKYLENVKSVGCLNENGEFIIPCEGLNTIRMSDEMIEIGDQMWEYRNEAISATVDDCWKIENILNNNGNLSEDMNDRLEDEE